jgi:hypothetical protein
MTNLLFKRIATSIIVSISLLATSRTHAKSIKIQIDANKIFRTVPAELFGHNWNCYENSGDGKDLTYTSTVRTLGATQLRIPGGFSEQIVWDDISCGRKDGWLLKLQDAISFARATGAHLQPVINDTGFWCEQMHPHAEAIRKASEWVTYMNVSPRAHYAKYWEVGNEAFIRKKDRGSDDGGDYGKSFADFYRAMKKSDPRIKIGAVAYESSEAKKGEWNAKAFKAMKAKGVIPDFLAIHSYPLWFPVPGRKQDEAPSWDKTLYAENPEIDAKILNSVSNAARYTDEINAMVTDNFGREWLGKIEYWMTEYRSSLEYKYIEFVDTMFCAQYLLELGRLGWKGANIWALKNGFNEVTKADYGLLRSGVKKDLDDQPRDSPRPIYYIFPFLSKMYGRNVVQASSESPTLRTWASKDGNGNLTIFMANNSPDVASALDAEISVKGFQLSSSAETWLFESSGTTVEGNQTPIQQKRGIRINGVENPEPLTLPGPAKALSISNPMRLSLPASSMMLIRIKNAKN